ncbi:MAG TPA: tetratricopeptide repeat protein [Gemmataceae bacterium]|nr:tetratricopeptide repeat protein [Gemmataceae bacterium]
MTRIRHACLVVAVFLPASSLCSAEPEPDSPGLADWQKGQQAMLEGENKAAIAAFRQSLEKDKTLVRNHLSLAAAYLAQGQEEDAAEQLEQYLRAQPNHYMVRSQYAELLLRLDRLGAARDQLERFEEDLPDHDSQTWQHLVRCHTRLMDIAQRSEDDYALHLHRGIALYWLARQRSELPDGDGELSSEGLLCQSASELVQARRKRPDEARPCWYLHEVWTQLALRQPATRWLRAAEEAAPFSYLTPAEQQRLHFARRDKAEDGSRK